MSLMRGLELAIEQAERQRDERAKAMARLAQHHQMLQGQMGQLQSYAQETEKRWITSSLQQISGEMVRHHYQFMGRLQQAMDLQVNVIASALQEIERARMALMDAEVRLNGLRSVLKSRQSLQNRQALKREQYQIDEWAALAHARKAATAGSGEQHDY